MAHPCWRCGGECYCHGSIDDVIVDLTPSTCDSCDCCQEMEESRDDAYGWDNDDFDYDIDTVADEDDHCPNCGHDRFDFSDGGCQVCCPHLYDDIEDEE